MHMRTQILNDLIEAYGYTSYCEIGVRNPADNFNLINIEAERKRGVDPSAPPGSQYIHLLSDNFFNAYDEEYSETTELFFIDGDHSHVQSKRDLYNALQHLSPGGAIVLHDCNPQSIEATGEVKPDNGHAWNGNVFQTMSMAVDLLNMQVYTVDVDHGCGVIRYTEPTQQDLYGEMSPLPSYADLASDRARTINLISYSEFKARLRGTTSNVMTVENQTGPQKGETSDEYAMRTLSRTPAGRQFIEDVESIASDSEPSSRLPDMDADIGHVEWQRAELEAMTFKQLRKLAEDYNIVDSSSKGFVNSLEGKDKK